MAFTFNFLLLLLFLSINFISTNTQSPSCLLELPLSNQCLRDISIQTVDQEIISYLCIIMDQRQLYQQSQIFCKEASLVNVQCAFRYFQSLLRNGQYIDAFKQEYALFFNDPFNHNHNITSSINKLKPTLQASLLKQKQFQLSQLNNFQKAIFFFYIENIQKSLSHLNSYNIEHPNKEFFAYEHFLMARILEKQSQYYDGLSYLSEAIKNARKPHPYLYHLKGNFLMHHVQFKKAIQQFNLANQAFNLLFNIKNGFSFTNYNLGLCYQKIHDSKNALIFYQRAVIDSLAAEAFNALGHSYFVLARQNQNQQSKKQLYKKAETYYKKAIQTNKDYVLAIYNLGVLSYENKQIQQSIYQFDFCLQKNPSFYSCTLGLIRSLYRLKSIDTAIYQSFQTDNEDQRQYHSKYKVRYDELINKMQKSEAVLADLAAILYSFEDYESMLALIAKYLKEHPEVKQITNIDLIESKGMHQYALELYEQAEYSFQRAIFLGSKQGYNYYNLGSAQYQLQKYQAANKSFTTANKIDSTFVPLTQEKIAICKQNILPRQTTNDL